MHNRQSLIGKSSKFLEVMRVIDLVSELDVPVLILGNTGTGKKTVAKYLHHNSKRKKLVVVNCAALPADCAETLLFGGSNNTKQAAGEKLKFDGYISQANSGTLFLQEVSALSPSIQARLLYFIENREILSDEKRNTQKFDVRILVSSHKNLRKQVDHGKFRADLFYRLGVVPVELPELLDREDDVILLIDYFFRKLVKTHLEPAPDFTKAALKKLSKYKWPGNIQELCNFCERMFLLFNGREIDITNLPIEIQNYTEKTIGFSFKLPETGIHLENLEVELIQQALHSSGGNKSKAARLLGLTRDTFLYRLRKYAIDV